VLSRPDGRPGARAVLAAIALGLAATLRAEPATRTEATGCAIPDAELEASGAVVGSVVINNFDIFDLDDPEEDKALFRAMNRLHVRTKAAVIRRQLLFEPGMPYQRRLLDESGRILRATAYLYDAEIELLSCEDGVVDVAVSTRDVWTLKPGISMSRSGGETRLGFDLQEDNFLGRGGRIRYFRRIDEERRSTEIGYSDRNLAGRWISIDTSFEDNSDGYVYAFGLERPFYALDTRRAGGGRILKDKREDPVYSLGDEIGKFRHEADYFDIYAGWSPGLSGAWVQRWRFGVVNDRRRFENVAESLQVQLVPEDRHLVYPYVGYEVIEDRFRRAANLDQIHRTEDISLGATINLRLGLLSRALGADRGGAVFSAVASRGYGDPDHRLWSFSNHASGRFESGELVNTVVGGAARWYLRQSERRLLFITLHVDKAIELDLDNPLEIGGDEGLRGYPLRYQRGDARAQFTIEQRYFTDYYLWRLFRVGGAVFFDTGRVWGDNPFGGENLGLLKDFGFGLRLSSTRSSIGKMIHVDFAFPLDGDPSIDSFQFLVEAKRSF
jgi:hypothetical protein